MPRCGRAGPHEGHEPSDDRPSCQDIEHDNRGALMMMAEGGEIRLTGGLDRDTFWFSIWNPFDPEAPSQARNGIGLRNVRERLEARYGNAAKLLIEATESTYEVALLLPVRAL